jgi:hypothetical protein
LLARSLALYPKIKVTARIEYDLTHCVCLYLFIHVGFSVLFHGGLIFRPLCLPSPSDFCLTSVAKLSLPCC